MIYINTPGYHVNTTISEPVMVTAPDVTLENVRINGSNREDILLTTHHRTKLISCVLLGSPQGAHRGIRIEGNGCRIQKTRVLNIFSDIHTQALSGDEGCQDLIAEDSELKAAGENVIFGGSFCGHEKLIPQDIKIINCDLSKEKEWLDDPTITCVNNFEIKNALRVKLKGCKMKGSRPGGGQSGYAIVLTVRQDPAPYCRIQDVYIENCEIEDNHGGVHILGHDDMFPPPQDGFGFLENVYIQNNRFRNMQDNALQFHINSGSKNLQIRGNSVHSGYTTNSILTFTNLNYLNENFVFEYNDVPEGRYGIIGEGMMGKECLEKFAPGYRWFGNTIREQQGYLEGV